MKLQVLVATMRQTDFSLVEKMNIQCDSIIANQHDGYSVDELITAHGTVKMISTPTRGVGLNRNIALMASEADILLFADDDIIYCDGALSSVKQAFDDLKEADAIIFSIDLTRNGEIFEKRHLHIKRMNFHNSLKYGTYVLAIRRSALLLKNIKFTHLFGGGCIYGSGEDSLFIRDCFKAGLKVYSHSCILGKCAKDSSSWFTGYNKKYLYDKGAWIACAFPKFKHLIKWYFVCKFSKMSQISFVKTLKIINKGIRGFKTLTTYDQIKESI